MLHEQRELNAAIQSGDQAAVSRLVHMNIKNMLEVRLTRSQLSVLDELKIEHGDMLNRLLSQAFRKGWVRQGGSHKLANAMANVLQVAQTLVRVYRLLNDGTSNSGQTETILK